MPKISQVTHKRVKEVAEKLEADGIYPSNDRVRAVTGGGSSIVAAHLSRWHEERNTAKLLEATVLEDSIKVAVHHEIERQVTLNTEFLQTLLDQQRDSCEAMHNELAETHAEIDNLNDEITKQTKHHQKALVGLEKEKTASETLCNELRQQLSSSAGDLRATNQKISDLEKQISRQDAQISLFEFQLAESRDKNAKDKDALREAEKAAAIAQTRLDEIERRSNNVKKPKTKKTTTATRNSRKEIPDG